MFDRLPDAVRPRPRRRRARPSEDQVRDPDVREDRGARGLPLLRQRGRRRATSRVADLAERYHAVIYAYGTATDRHLGIPGEDLPGSHAATEFVNWYNAHPDFADREFDLSCNRVVVIGNGNVAADVARMLALTRAELEETDTADHAIDAARRLRRRGDRRPRPARPGAGGVHQPRGARAGRDGRRRHRHRARPRSSWTRSAGPTSSPRTPTRPAAATSRSSPTSPGASRRASAGGSCCGSCARRSRSRATAGSSRS